jgi:hypothetical protein
MRILNTCFAAILLIIFFVSYAYSQSKPELFVSDWKAKTIEIPVGINKGLTTNEADIRYI